MRTTVVFEPEKNVSTASDVFVDGRTFYAIGAAPHSYSGAQIHVSSNLKQRTIRRVKTRLETLLIAGKSWIAGGEGALYRSESSGKAWTRESLPTDEQIMSLVRHQGVLWVAGESGYLAREHEEGDGAAVRWRPLKRPGAPPFNGPPGRGTSYPYPEVALTRLRVVGDELYALGRGLWRLDMAGAHLELESKRLLVDLARTTLGTLIVCGVDGALYRRVAGGSSSRKSLRGPCIDDVPKRTYVGVVALADGVLLASTCGEGALRWSTDDGKTFSPLADPRVGGSSLAEILERHRIHLAVADGHGGALVSGWQGLLLHVSSDVDLASDPAAEAKAGSKPRVKSAKETAGPPMAPPRKNKIGTSSKSSTMSESKSKSKSTQSRSRSNSKSSELLAMVLAHPNDDTPRLVYADWLLEQGDPRGEFIQVQCALGRPLRGAKGQPVWNSLMSSRFPSDTDDDAPTKKPANHLALEQREQALFKRHATQWLEPIREFIREWDWRRGFLDRLTAGPAFFRGADRVFGGHPILHLTLEGLDPQALALLATTPLPGVRSLDVNRQRISATTVSCLLGENLAALEELELWGNPIGDAGLVRLAKEGKLTALKWLSLEKCTIGDVGLTALAASTVLSNLERLNLERNKISDAGVHALAESRHLPRLREVELGRKSGISPKALAALRKRLK